MDMKVAIGERIAQLRKAKKLSQQKFSYDAEIERSYLTHVEKGRKNISIDTLVKITNALGISLKEFFNADVFNGKKKK
ncbi:MAG: helix-turn-helix domain-containing protein [Ginsengibacter sp.]